MRKVSNSQSTSTIRHSRASCLSWLCRYTHAPFCMHDYAVVILNWCNAFSAKSQLPSKRLRGLDHISGCVMMDCLRSFCLVQSSGCVMIDCLRSFCLVQSSGFVHLAALGAMILHYVTVKTVVLVGLTWMHKTGCSGETRLVLHVPSSSQAGRC